MRTSAFSEFSSPERTAIIEVEVLEDHADGLSFFKERLARQGEDVHPVDKDLPFGGFFQAVEEADQGRLARPGETDDAVDLSPVYMEGDIVHRPDGTCPRFKYFADMFGTNHDFYPFFISKKKPLYRQTTDKGTNNRDTTLVRDMLTQAASAGSNKPCCCNGQTRFGSLDNRPKTPSSSSSILKLHPLTNGHSL